MRKPVQLKARQAVSPAGVMRAAASGLEGVSRSLPHLGQIQKSFGKHEVADVRAFVGGRAQEANDRMGALAYATGDAVAFRDAPDLQDTARRFEVFVTFCADMRELGPANFPWQDGDVLHVHSDRRHFETRNGLTDARPPGLHMLRPDAEHSDGRHALVGAEIDALPKNAVICASLPLSDHRWEPLARGTVLSISAGHISFRSSMQSD